MGIDVDQGAVTDVTRMSSLITTVSWIPSESVPGLATKAVFATVAHYDDPPPDVITGESMAGQRATLEEWRAADGFRFANQLSAWIDVDATGAIVDAGYDGDGMMGSTTVGAAGRSVTFAGASMPVIQCEPQHGDGWVRFVQSSGGRTGAPMPRRVNHPPFVRFMAPLVWTTLGVTLYTDGGSDHEVLGASPFPRHWVYGPDGRVEAKVGTTDYSRWFRGGRPSATPWGDADSPALVTAVETALERELASTIMRGGRRPRVRRVRAGAVVVEQGSSGTALYLLLDGVLVAEVDGEAVAELGPGAVVGERSGLEGGVRTATLRAVTDCRVAEAIADQLDLEAHGRLAAGHRHEHEHRRAGADTSGGEES